MPEIINSAGWAAMCAALAIATLSRPLQAHPMPDAEIIAVRSSRSLTLDIRIPLSDLLLVLPPSVSRDPETLLRRDRAALRAYFATHIRLITPGSAPRAFRMDRVALRRDRDAGVGAYAELEIGASTPVPSRGSVALAYDAVIHRIANKRAFVRDGKGRLLGVIRYDLSMKRALPLTLP